MKERRFDTLIVTSGQKGAKLFAKKNYQLSLVPFSDYSVDKIGAGDSILSISSFAIFSKFNYDLALLMGSLAAASTVKSIGNKAIVDKAQFFEH